MPTESTRISRPLALEPLHGELALDGVPLAPLAREHGTPLFVYSAETIRRSFRRIASAFAEAKPLIAYSVKANSAEAIIRLLAREGAGFDIVSAGELARVQRAGVAPDRVIFAGVGKTEAEIRAALVAGVRDFNCESPMEAERINAVAASLGTVAPIALRVNPDVDARTHEKIATGKKENKFGMSFEAAFELADRLRSLPHLRLEGIHAHIGSQILETGPHAEAVAVIDRFLGELIRRGHPLRSLNFGGGFGIAYREDQRPLDLGQVAPGIMALARRHGLQLLLEPGRSIIGPAGLLLTEVQYIKQGEAKTFVIIDGSMNEVIRPTLYQAYHEIVPVKVGGGPRRNVDVVGPVCESGDYLAKDRELAVPAQGDLLAVLDAGAYCSAMASNYNTRCRPAEVLIDGGKAHLIRRRETLDELLRNEVVPSHLA